MSSQATFVAYIDESGDEGLGSQPGTSDWFVLGAAVLRRDVELEQVKLVDAVRDAVNARRQEQHRIPEKKPLHFRDFSHEQRKLYADHVGKASLRTACVLIHKPDLTSPESFQANNRLYHYAVRMLVERISWYCRDHKRKVDGGDGSCELVFSSRNSLDYAAIRDYLDYLDNNREALGYKAAPGIIRREQVSTFSPGRRMGLQIADALASSYFFALNKNEYGFTEEAYAKLILPRAYRHQGKLWGYGLKILPREAEERRRTGVILPGWEQ